MDIQSTLMRVAVWCQPGSGGHQPHCRRWTSRGDGGRGICEFRNLPWVCLLRLPDISEKRTAWASTPAV